MKHSKTLLAYLAGIIDGEGALYIARRKDHRKETHSFQYQCQLIVAMTCKPVIDLLQLTFGGHVHEMNREHWKSYKSYYKPAWIWRCDSRIADVAVRELYPYLITKKKHADAFLDFQKTIVRTRDSHGMWNHLTESNLQEKERCYLIIKGLNVKGHKPR